MSGSLYSLALLAGPLPLAVFVARSASSGAGPYARALAVLTVLVVWCSVQASLGVALGAVGLLRLEAVLAGELALAALGGVALLSLRGRSPRHDPDAPAPPAGAITALVAGAGIGCLAVLAGLVLTRPITDYDSLLYHLPTMASWYQHGALVRFDQFRGEQIGVYPYAWEVVCSLFFFPLGDDTLVAIPNLVAWTVLGLSVFLLALETGARSSAAAAFALASLQTPVTLEQVDTLHVDLPMAAFFLSGLVYVVRFARSGFVEHLALLACSGALLVGIKMSGLTYAALLLGVLLVLLVRRRREAPGAAVLLAPGGPAFGLGVLAIASLALAAGSWYVWNLIELGNPLGLMKVAVGDLVLLPGTLSAEEVKRTTLAHLFDPTSRTHLRVLYEALLRELGPFFPIAAACCATLPVVLWRRAGADRAALAAASGLAVLAAALYWTTPYGADTPNGMNGWRITAWIGQGMRYALPLLGLATVVAARCASAWPIPDLVFAALAAASVASLAVTMPLLFAAAFALAALASAPPVMRHLGAASPGARALRTLGAVAVLGAIFFLGSLGRTARHEARAGAYGRIVEEVDRLPPAAVVGYVMSEKSYLLYGRSLDRRVVFVPLEGSSAAEYMEQVQRAGADVLAVGPIIGGFAARDEAGWFTRPDPPFERLTEGEITREVILFKVPAGDATRPD